MNGGTAAAAGKVAVLNTRKLAIIGLMAGALAMAGCQSNLDGSDSGLLETDPTMEAVSGGTDDAGSGVTNSDTGTSAGAGSQYESDASEQTEDATTGETASGDGASTGDTSAANEDTSTADTGTVGEETTDQPAPPNGGTIYLSWRTPSERENGEALAMSDLSGYRIYYGPTTNPTANTVAISDAAVTTYELDNMVSGTYEVAVSAIDLNGLESALSNPMRKTIQ